MKSLATIRQRGNSALIIKLDGFGRLRLRDRRKAGLTCYVFEGALHWLTADLFGQGGVQAGRRQGHVLHSQRPRQLPEHVAARASGHVEQWDKLYAASVN